MKRFYFKIFDYPIYIWFNIIEKEGNSVNAFVFSIIFAHQNQSLMWVYPITWRPVSIDRRPTSVNISYVFLLKYRCSQLDHT